MIGGSPHISGSTFADNVASSSVLALRNGTTLSNTIIAHNEGKAVVSAGTRESMEVDVSKLHAAGLWATMQQDR